MYLLTSFCYSSIWDLKTLTPTANDSFSERISDIPLTDYRSLLYVNDSISCSYVTTYSVESGANNPLRLSIKNDKTQIDEKELSVRW